MHQDEIITGLDIGSSSVRIVVGQRIMDGNDQKMHIIGAAEVESAGINKGVITSIEDAVSCISSCLENVERVIGFPIESAWVGISGTHITSQEGKGVVAVSRADGEIQEQDVERAIDSARSVATPLNYEILHVIPKSFTIDNQQGIKDPVGMSGIRLEVDAQIIHGLTSQIKNLTKCIYRTGMDIEDLVLSILASSEAVLTNKQKDLGVVAVNIGGSTTSMAVFEEGEVLHSAVLPIGSDHITSDIAIGLRISIETAEKIKLEYGTVLPGEVGKKEEIDLNEVSDAEDGSVMKKYVAEIIEARVEEIFDKIDKELKKINRSGMLPAGVVFTGGGSKISGLIDFAKKKLRLPASLGYPIGISSIVDKINDLSFSTAVGLVLWGDGMRQQRGQTGIRRIMGFRPIEKITSWTKKIFKAFAP